MSQTVIIGGQLNSTAACLADAAQGSRQELSEREHSFIKTRILTTDAEWLCCRSGWTCVEPCANVWIVEAREFRCRSNCLLFAARLGRLVAREPPPQN